MTRVWTVEKDGVPSLGFTGGREIALYVAGMTSGVVRVWEWVLDPKNPTHECIFEGTNEANGKEETPEEGRGCSNRGSPCGQDGKEDAADDEEG